MSPIDFIVIAIIAAVIGGASYYIYRAKKNGKKCIGCPYADSCKRGMCSCNCSDSENE